MLEKCTSLMENLTLELFGYYKNFARTTSKGVFCISNSKIPYFCDD